MKHLAVLALALSLVVAGALAGCDSSGGEAGVDIQQQSDVVASTDTGSMTDTGEEPGVDVVIDPVEDTVTTTDTGVDPVEDAVTTTDTGIDPVEDTVTVTDTGGSTDTGTTTTCSGACDPTTDTDISCLADGMTLCYCNGDTSTWTSLTCADYCGDMGAEGDQCSADAEEYCSCTWDCTDSAAVASTCEELLYTPCTCAVADPCVWIEDGYCDIEYCDQLFPEQDNFDDTETDCVAPVQDCTDTTAVQESCDNGEYTNCTCEVADPCGWVGDEYCDHEYCDEHYPDQTNFDDSADCTE